MSDRDVAFVGAVPENYDRHLGPLFFHGYADDLAARLRLSPGLRVLEVACGTGIVTARLARRLAGQGTLVATDLNEPMLAYAKSARALGAEVEWRQADATALPFDDASFDAVVCAVSVQYLVHPVEVFAQARRVLRPGGLVIVSFSNRCFPTKAVLVWLEAGDDHHRLLVRGYLAAAGFDDAVDEEVPTPDDPLFVVSGRA